MQTRSGGGGYSRLQGSAPQHPVPSVSSCRQRSSTTWTTVTATRGRDAARKRVSLPSSGVCSARETDQSPGSRSEFVKVRLASRCQPVPFCLRVEEPGSPSAGSAWERADPEAHCTVPTQPLQPAGHAPQMRPTHTAREPALDGAQSERCGELRTYEFTQTAHG